MRAGQLDKRVTIKYKSVTQDPTYGTNVVTWLSLITQGSPAEDVKLWANVADVPPSRSESVKMGLEMARNQSKITIRYRTDIDSSMKITVHYDNVDVDYQIVGGPAMIGRKDWLEMVCEKYSS